MTATGTQGGAGTDQVEKRNFLLNSVEGALFFASGAFINAQTVLPALVNKLGGNTVTVGAVGVLVYFGLFLPQIFSARHVETLAWKQRWVLRMGFLHRMFVLVIGLTVLIFGGTRPTLALWLFLVIFTMMQMTIGVATPGWFDLFAKLTPARKRGRLVGVRNSVGGAAAFVGGLALTWMLGGFPFPVSYALAMFAAFAFQMSSWITQLWLVEAEPSQTSVHRPIFAFLRELPEVFRNTPAFKNFIISSMVLTVAAMPVGFFTVYALKRFSADESVVGEFTLTMVAIQVVSSLVNGFIADRYGNKPALLIAAAALLCASVTALLAPSLAWFKLVYLFLGINLGTELMARANMSIEYGPARKRSTYVGLMNTMVAPFYLSGLVGGMLIEWLNFGVVFGVGAVFSLAGLLILRFKVIDPRVVHSAAARG